MKVKICGLLTASSVACAVAAGADLIGFVFAPSKRQVTVNEAQKLAANIPPGVATVGVFVNPKLSEVLALIEAVPLDMVQLHGDESVDFVQALPVPVIKALKLTQLEVWSQYPDNTLFLLDSPGTTYAGGSGQPFTWETTDLGDLPRSRILVAGGLTVTNVRTAINWFKPYGVDVSSGVETEGVKDLEKIKKFIAIAKGE